MKWMIGGLILFLLLPVTYAADDFSALERAFNTPVQTWRNAELGILTLGGDTRIYGFNDEDKDLDDQIKIKLNSIADNDAWKKFCHIGYVENKPPGYRCETDVVDNIINFDTIPKFDVDFNDVENITMINSSIIDREFTSIIGEFELPIVAGSYNKITIRGSGIVTFPIGDFKIKNLELGNAIKVIFPEGSNYEINQISTSSWLVQDKISLTSYANSLTVKDVTFSNAELYLEKGHNRFERLTVTNSSILKVHADATIFLMELNISNSANVFLDGKRSRLNFKAKQYTLSDSASKVYFSNGIYHIYNYNNGSGQNESLYQGDVTIVSNRVRLSGSYKKEIQRIKIFALDDKNGSEANFEILGSANICVNAFSRRRISITENGEIIGSVIADQIQMGGSGRIRYYPGSACSEAEVNPNNYQLQLTPVVNYSLICQPQRLQFQVLDSNNQPTGSFAGSIDITPSNANLTPVSGKGSGSDGRYTPNSAGELWLDLRVAQGSGSQTLTISGTLNPQGSSGSVTGTYHFVPYKFATQEQYVIANKPQAVEVKVLACNDDGDVVDVNYSGTPQVSSAWVAPTSDVAQGDLTFTPVFTQGVANSELTMEDSGHKTVALEDDSFDCSELVDDCPIEGKAILKGSFEVYARPWTLAICSPSGHEMNGDIIDQESVGFAAAGAAFDLHLRPLRWVSNSGDKSDPLTGGNAIDTSEYCNSLITQNFFSDMASLETKVQLTHQVAQPERGYDGELKGTLEQLNTAGKENVPFNGLSWSEVGVLRVNADIDGTYLGMKVNQGYRNIGRFYPAWLKIISNDWDYATDHNDFVYMDQAIPYRFVVEAQNTDGNPTRNYSQFAHELIADVKLLAVDSDGEELGARINDYALQLWGGSGDGQWSGARLVVTNDFIFKKDQVVEEPYTTVVDGPYQNGFGLRVLDKVDSKIKVDWVDFIDPDLDLKASGTLIDTGKSFASQPDIRYGRMVMDDVGGTSVSRITIPLRVEYWQGSRFTTNHADSGSVYATLDNYICKQTLWPSPSSPSNAKLSGSDTEPWNKVSQGQSKQLVAEPHATEDTQGLREQIRFWLRLDNDQTNLEDNKRSPQVGEEGVNCGTQYTSQPWLQYNWFARGDEDPSAVVTFGIHRGNDKIIFRGETRLSGQ
ncbi:MSHA biogenesis protein MshQ [Vibrio sp. dsl-7]|uniref:MSHA biogenesis protein MshQ n=1 Tax=Vibrio chanodichtyis TaxID=3027932 RepID=A0ABT5V2C1_9VIBR|nr:DUF6701 domain-containing protein [Vibrio chanodichtyis]MDE1515800.1 MSHA biogenesis protein MshQ [Vibrio chanodichtyis]